MIYIDRAQAPAPAAASWVSPDLATWSLLSGNSYDATAHAASTYTNNGGTMVGSGTHGEPNAAKDSGGIVSADLGLTIADVRGIVVEVDIGTIPTTDTLFRGIGFAVINTNALEDNKGAVLVPGRLSSGNYQAGTYKVGSNIVAATGVTGPWGKVVMSFPFTADGPATGSIVAKGATAVSVKDIDPALAAYDTGVRLALFYIRAQAGTNTAIAIPFSGLRYQVLTA